MCSSDLGKKLYDRFLSGYYIISALRHKFDQENNFETVLEVIKDSYSGRKELYEGQAGLTGGDINPDVGTVISNIKNNSFF